MRPKMLMAVLSLASLTLCQSALAEKYRYNATVVRGKTPLVFKARGVDADTQKWSLCNAVGGAWTIKTTSGGDGVVTVTFTVTKALKSIKSLIDEGIASSPMLVWQDGDKVVNIPLLIISAKAKTPRKGSEVRPENLHGQSVWVLASYTYGYGNWGKIKPVFYIPVPPRK